LSSSAENSYQWFKDGSPFATTQSINVTIAGSYTVQITNANGCSATSAATIVTVNANPATPTITPDGPTAFCAGGSVNLPSTSATTYQWFKDGSPFATTQSINVTIAGSYTVQITNASGCSAMPAPPVVTVNANPATPTITPDGPTTFCAGASVNLNSTSATTYQWFRDGSPIATTQSILVNAPGSYTVQVTNANGCSATSAATIVTVNASPATPTITPDGSTTFCTGGSVNLTSSSATSYQWFKDGSPLATTQ